MTSLELRRVVKEFQEDWVDARVRKSYQPQRDVVVLRLGRKGGGTGDLTIATGRRFYISMRSREMPTQPSGFAMVLRKHLNNARLIAIEQLGFDRSIELTFEHGGGRPRLIVESFRDGNIMLLDSDGVIIRPLIHATYKDRTLRAGMDYTPPPIREDPTNMTQAHLADILSKSSAGLVATLASRAGFGGPLAREIVELTGLDGDAEAGALQENERERVLEVLRQRLKATEIPQPVFITLPNEEAFPSIPPWKIEGNCAEIDATIDPTEAALELPIDGLGPTFNKPENHHLRSTRLSAVIDLLWGGLDSLGSEASESTRDPKDSIDDPLERRRVQQNKAIGSHTKKIERWRDLGLAIEQAAEVLEGVLEATRSEIENHGWERICSPPKKGGWITGGSAAEGKVMVRLPDDDGNPGQTVVELEVEKNTWQNAQSFYAKSKKSMKKKKGAQTALMETEHQIARAAKSAAKQASGGRTDLPKRRRRFWFERFRWGVIEDGHLVLGGRDAKGNDALARKHMDRIDRYLHTDVHGAPSCILKSRIQLIRSGSHFDEFGCSSIKISEQGEGGLGDDHLNQAAILAAAWSKAFGATRTMVYAVEPPQVTKQTESGEYIGRGSFVVRGQRHWTRDPEARIGLGIARLEGELIVCVGTINGIQKLCERWTVIIPGQMSKEVIARRIAKATGIGTDELVSALPSGPLDFGEDHGLLVSSEKARDEEE